MQSSSWMAKIDELLSTRLYNGHKAFEKYDLSFFGQWIQMTGNTEMNHMNGKEYFYIDCGYLFFLYFIRNFIYNRLNLPVYFYF